MPVSRVIAAWSGWSGAPGITALHFADIRGAETAHLTKVRTFLEDFVGTAGNALWLPGIININVSPIVETFDEVSGDLLATTFGTAPPVIDGIGTGGFAASTGACISWSTNLVHDVPGAAAGPRLVRGRTFIVPLTSSVYAADGTIENVPLGDFNNAVGAFISANPDFVIWSRPVNGAGGAFGVAVAGIVRDKAAVLRSRRD